MHGDDGDYTGDVPDNNDDDNQYNDKCDNDFDDDGGGGEHNDRIQLPSGPRMSVLFTLMGLG